MKNLVASFVLVLTLNFGFAQKLKADFIIQYSSTKGAHSRALAFDNGSVFVGSNFGEVFEVQIEKREIISFEKKNYKELRDILVLPNDILLVSSGDSSAILQYKRQTRSISRIQLFNGVFLDGIAASEQKILALGDPILGEFALFEADKKDFQFKPIPSVISTNGEAAYAASGSTIVYDNGFHFFTGGMKNRLASLNEKDWVTREIPFDSCATCGTYSGIVEGKKIYAVGGNYLKPNDCSSNYLFSKNKGKTWQKSKHPPLGYRSSIVKNGKLMFTAGTNGLDVSTNQGKTWVKVTDSNYFALLITDEYLVASTINGTLEFFNLDQWKK